MNFYFLVVFLNFFVFQGLTPSSLVSIDVAKLFRGIETLFPIVIDSLYSGVQVVSPQDVTNNLLNSVYNTLELQVCCLSTDVY